MDTFNPSNYPYAKQLVELFHYSHYVPTNIQYSMTLDRNGVPVAGVLYSVPATRWSEDVLELCRLVRDELFEPKPVLTQLIGQSIKYIRRDRKFDLIISFADSTHGHHGGIYQASSWNYHTIRKPRLDGFIVDGRFVAARTCNHRWGTSSKIKLPKILLESGITCIPHFDKGKHLYWKSLDNNGEKKAQRLGLTKSPYPKPNCSSSSSIPPQRTSNSLVIVRS